MGLSEAKQSAYQYFVPTADLSALAGFSTIPMNLLITIIGPYTLLKSQKSDCCVQFVILFLLVVIDL